MADVEVKSFDSPDETRPFEGKGKAEVLQMAGHPVARGTFEPGWKWSNNVKPIAQTDSCKVAHFGYCLQGSMKIYMDDGGEREISAGNAFAIPPGHDAEVTSGEACVLLDFGEIGDYAKRS
jgi:mannose-6-phosphate isomerase-like protein (cupin superfamily)